MYHYGPDFLLKPISDWPPIRPANANPIKEPLNADIAAMNLLAIDGTTEEPQIAIEVQAYEAWPLRLTSKLENWDAKLRRIALFKKVLLKLKESVLEKKTGLKSSRLRPKNRNGGKFLLHLSQEEKEDAENLLIKAVQNISF